MFLSELARLKPGELVCLYCCTSSANIFYKGPAEADRKRYTPTGPELSSITYQLEGRFIGLETENIDYLVLESQGEAAIIGLKRGRLCVIGTETRLKTQHIPISAIVTVRRHG
ncbi:hypothetical protein [Spirosoma endbachense]|uniref:Uncharacterized protein n=1 Tax=Spirosoma endbachense TaxID=2666025 RepID=A0A6P1W2E2_9BACT|nr:hypothetical protein [Spirosoma endbachense]QHV99215.1 hypothetical protein GJR95_31250 [Spirosoma endbachense]